MPADCSALGLNRVTITRQSIFKCSLHVTVVGVLLHVTTRTPTEGVFHTDLTFQSTWVSRFNYEVVRGFVRW